MGLDYYSIVYMYCILSIYVCITLIMQTYTYINVKIHVYLYKCNFLCFCVSVFWFMCFLCFCIFVWPFFYFLCFCIFVFLWFFVKSILAVNPSGMRDMETGVPPLKPAGPGVFFCIINIDFESVNSPSKGNFDIILKTIK